MTELAVEARGLVKLFDGKRAVDGIDLAVPAGSIFGVLGPNGAGKTTTLRMLLGILDPDMGERIVLGERDPLRAAPRVGYLPEERGLYPAMNAKEAIAFLGALRGLSLAEGRRRAVRLLEEAGLGEAMGRPIRTLSKGMAQTVQLLGTIVHEPRLIVLDEPFSGLDALNQSRLEGLIRAQVAGGATVLFSTHVIAHAERLCERIAIIKGRVRFDGTVAEARERLPQRVRLATRAADGPWRAALPADAAFDAGEWSFALPADGIEPVLKALVEGKAGIETLSIERPSLHEAFVDLVGSDASAVPDEVIA
jgi:ABC-2 type transport system ATP-binding protein